LCITWDGHQKKIGWSEDLKLCSDGNGGSGGPHEGGKNVWKERNQKDLLRIFYAEGEAR